MSEPGDLRYITDAPDYRHLEDRDRYKALYDEVGTLPANRVVRWRAEWMRFFSPAPNSSILELGAHNGPNLFHYARLGHTVDGVEISDTLLATFEEHLAKEPAAVRDRIRMFRSWIEEFVPSRRYDYVLLAEVLEHVADPVATLETARRAMGSHSILYVTSPATHWGNNTHVRAVPPDDLDAWLAGAGLESTALEVMDDRTVCLARVARSSRSAGAGTPRVALLSGDAGRSRRFHTRVAGPVERLVTRGELSAAVATRHDGERAFVSDAALSESDVWILQRFGLDRGRAESCRRVLLRMEKPFVFEIDDLPLGDSSVDVDAVRWLLEHAALAVVRTSAVAPWALHYGAKQVMVIPDSIDPQEWVQDGESATSNAGPLAVALMAPERVDAAIVAPLLDRLATLSDVRVVAMDESADAWSAESLLRRHGDVDVALVPLADTDRNRCRSPLPWMEFAAAGVPAVLGADGPFSGVVRNGVDGLLLDASPSTWSRVVPGWLAARDERRAMAERARRRVTEAFHVDSAAALWRNAIDLAIAGAR